MIERSNKSLLTSRDNKMTPGQQDCYHSFSIWVEKWPRLFGGMLVSQMTRLCQCHFCHFILTAIQTSFISNHNYHDLCWLRLKNNGTWNNLEVHTNVPVSFGNMNISSKVISSKAGVSWFQPKQQVHYVTENFSFPRIPLVSDPTWLLGMHLWSCLQWFCFSVIFGLGTVTPCQSWFFRIWNSSMLAQKTYSPNDVSSQDRK